MPPPKQCSQTVSLLCSPGFLRRWCLGGRKEPVSCGQKAFQSDKKICVSTFCQGARGRRSEPLASFSEERQSLIGLLFHSICRPASCRPQLHTFEPATVTLHTSLQPVSCTLPLTADRSCLSSDTHCRLMCGLQSYMLVMRLLKTLAGTCVNFLLGLKLRMNYCQFIQYTIIYFLH